MFRDMELCKHAHVIGIPSNPTFIYNVVKLGGLEGYTLFEPRCEKTGLFVYAKTKTQIRCAVTAQLISAFVFAIRIVQSFYFLNPKFQASSYHLWLHSPVCVRPVFSQRGSILSYIVCSETKIKQGGKGAII